MHCLFCLLVHLLHIINCLELYFARTPANKPVSYKFIHFHSGDIHYIVTWHNSRFCILYPIPDGHRLAGFIQYEYQFSILSFTHHNTAGCSIFKPPYLILYNCTQSLSLPFFEQGTLNVIFSLLYNLCIIRSILTDSSKVIEERFTCELIIFIVVIPVLYITEQVVNSGLYIWVICRIP